MYLMTVKEIIKVRIQRFAQLKQSQNGRVSFA